MKKQDVCLNHNDPQVILWFTNVGEEETYRQLVINNGVLPDWSERYSLEFRDAKNFLNSFIPADNYNFKRIGDILFQLPVGTQAAFWNDTFYFKDKISAGELGEEAFHSIISTILTNEQRDEFYREAEEHIKSKGININSLIDEMLKAAPQIYSKLTPEDLKKRVLEERIAAEFREFFTSPNKASFSISKFLKDLFNTILSLFGMGDRQYISTLFNDIKKGKYKDSKVLYSENATPSTYMIMGMSAAGVEQQVGEADSEQVMRNLVANYFKVRDEEDLSHGEIIREVFSRARAYYDIYNPIISGAFIEKETTIDEDTFEEVEINNKYYKELVDELSSRVKDLEEWMFDAIEEDQGDENTDENAPDVKFSDSDSANEKGWDTISEWLKTYIKTVSYVTNITLPDGRTIEFAEAVDEQKIYYGLARALNNSRNDFERLMKLIQYGSLEGNSAANAMLTKLIKDVSGSRSYNTVIQNIKNDYYTEGGATPFSINNYVNPERAYILQNVLKGFDLWSRTTTFQTVSPETGKSVTSNENVNNAVANQLGNWQQAQLALIPDVAQIKSIRGQLSTTGDFSAKLEDAIKHNQDILLSNLGVAVSRSTLKWLLINNAIATSGSRNISKEDFVYYNVFASEIASYDTKANIDGLLSNLRDNINDRNINDLYDSEIGVRGRLETLAKINALFDESVFESSYKNAEGKTIFGFQRKTFDLEFVANLQDEKFVSSLLNNGAKAYRTDEDGNDVYLTESKDFFEKNIFLRRMYKKDENGKWVKDQESKISKILPYFKLESFGGMRQVSDQDTVLRRKTELQAKKNDAARNRQKELVSEYELQIAELDALQGREGDGVTFSNILTKDFDLFRLNAMVNRVLSVKLGPKETINLIPHYIGNLEAKRTADFIFLPEIEEELIEDGTLNKAAIALIKEELRKEYDRIKRVSAELQTAVSENSNKISFNSETNKATLDATILREILGRDVYEKYHTGTVSRQDGIDAEGNPTTIYKFAGARALEFSDGVLGVLDKQFMKTILVDSALSGTDFNTAWTTFDLSTKMKDHWRNIIFKQHYDRLESNNLVPLMDARWKNPDGSLNKQMFEKYIVQGYINTLGFNQLMHGDNALVFKNDGADFAKRKGGANAAIESSETYLIAPSLGITEVKDRIKYVTAKEIVSRVGYQPSETVDQADAQNYSTTEYKRYLLWSRGKLDKGTAKILDQIELGIPLTQEQRERMISKKAYLNIDKTVAYNGFQYLKKSDFMLSKEFTSVLKPSAQRRLAEIEDQFGEEAREIRMDENNWGPAPDAEFHHYLRQTMEGWRTKEGRLVKDSSKRFDLYMPVSASKMLNINVFDPATISEEDGWNSIDGSIVFIEAKNYGLQLENPAGKKRIIDPSQMIEIIFNEQDGNVEVWKEGNDKPVAISSLETLYQQYLTDRDNSVFELAYNQIFDENDKFDASVFFPKAVKSLISSGADPQVIKLFELNKDTGQYEYNPNMGITKDKFVNLLFAHFTKGVLQQKISGDALAHVSSYGIKPLKRIVRVEIGKKGSGVFDYTWEVVRRGSIDYNRAANGSLNYTKLNLEDTYNDDVNNGVIYDPTLPTDRLREELARLYNKREFYFTDELRHLKPRYKILDFGTDVDGSRFTVVHEKPIAYYSESMMPAYRADDQNINNNNKWNFGVRIPSQDKHSAVNVEWVDVLPVFYGNTIATAKEIVTISGSDFDIDKLFLHKPELYNYRGKVMKYGTGDPFIEYIEFLKDFHKEFNDRFSEIPINEKFDENLINLLKELRLPTSAEGFNNPYVINNRLLELKQLALTNDGTLLPKTIKDSEGREIVIPAIYKTAATMDVLKKLDKKANNIFLDENNVSVFDQTDNLPNHIFDKHSVTHTKNSVGKQNINPYVNGNLGLILAIRAGYKINKDFRITINGHTIQGFGYISTTGRRIFDDLSALISAATDEAKEQLNAKYNLNLEGAVIVKGMISLGWSFDTAMAFVNQPIVQKYLKMKQDRIQTIYLESEFDYKSESDIIQELVGDLEERYTGEYGDEQLGKSLHGLDPIGNNPSASEEGQLNSHVFDKRIIYDLKVINSINEQLSQLTRFMKVKKGFTGGLTQLDQLNSAIESLGFKLEGKEAYTFSLANPINTQNTLTDPNIRKAIPQIVNVVNNIVPQMNKVAKKLLLDRNDGFRFLKETVLGQLKNVNQVIRGRLEKEIESYIYLRLYLEETGGDVSLLTTNLFNRSLTDEYSTVGQTLIALKREVNRIARDGAQTADEKRLLNLYGTSILKRLTVKYKNGIDELKLDTFAKLSVEEQDTLITSYATMVKNLNYLSDDYIEFKNLPKQLFAYWIMKDAFQAKFGSVSKLFPVTEFKEHSNSIDRALAGQSDLFNALNNSDVFNVFTKDILNRLAKNSANMKNFRSFYVPVDKDAPQIHTQDFKINLAALKRLDPATQIKVLGNYPFKYTTTSKGGVIEEVNIANIPLYLKTKSMDYQTGSSNPVMLKLSSFKLNTGAEFNSSMPSFISSLNERKSEIVSLEYKKLPTKFIGFHSTMTDNLAFTPITVDQNEFTNFHFRSEPKDVTPTPEMLVNMLKQFQEDFLGFIKDYPNMTSEAQQELSKDYGKAKDYYEWLRDQFRKYGKELPDLFDLTTEDVNFEVVTPLQLTTSNMKSEIQFEEEPTTGYRNRTIKNASADATIAFAVDFSSAGEKLTKSSVLGQGKLYISIDANNPITDDIVRDVAEKLNKAEVSTLNIAGNGIYTMKGKYTQQQVDDYTSNLLSRVIPLLNKPLSLIRSGGQTGFDEAGVKAARKLGIPSLVLAPKGWVFRNVQGQDVANEQQFKDRFKENQEGEETPGCVF